MEKQHEVNTVLQKNVAKHSHQQDDHNQGYWSTIHFGNIEVTHQQHATFTLKQESVQCTPIWGLAVLTHVQECVKCPSLQSPWQYAAAAALGDHPCF